MKLEDQVTSLELAKRLKELGVKAQCEFWWNPNNGGWLIGAMDEGMESYPAFTVAELGEMLPPECSSSWSYDKRGRWSCENYVNHQEFFAATEADARAKMLIYLAENKLLVDDPSRT